MTDFKINKINKVILFLTLILFNSSSYAMSLTQLIQGLYDNDSSIKSEGAANLVVANSTLIVPLNGIINSIEEIKKLTQKKDNNLFELKKIKNKLENKQFMENAPEKVVAQYKNHEQEIKSSIEKIEQIIDTIK